jgi:hypothetical protein
VQAQGVFFSGGGMVQLDTLLSQFAGVISGFDLGDGVDGSHPLSPGSKGTPGKSVLMRTWHSRYAAAREKWS